MRNKKNTINRFTKIKEDPIYKSILISRITNQLMQDGRKTIAAKIIYQALDIIKEGTKTDPLEYLLASLENVKPEIEIRSRRVGGANYQVPVPVPAGRKESLAIRWIIKAAGDRPNKTYHTFGEKLAAELMEAHESLGGAMKKKQDVHKMAEANKAFAHFRW